MRCVPEIRIDPLSGHKTIVAGERSRRPGGEPGRWLREGSPEPIDPGRDPFAEGNEDRTPPELYAVRPGGGPPDSPGWTVRVIPNLFPALTPLDGAAPNEEVPRAKGPAGAALLAAGYGRARGDRQWTSAGAVAGRASPRAGDGGGGDLARAHARALRERVRAADRQRAARGRRIAAAHARAAICDGLRARRGRARARALGRLHDAHDGPEPARRPGRRGGAPARADRGDRRGGGADGALRLAPALPADARARAGRARASRTTAHPAARSCTTGCAGWRATSARVPR